MARTFYYWDTTCLEHDTGRHVECIDRARRLEPSLLQRTVPKLDPQPIIEHDAVEWICKLHVRDYHDWVRQRCETQAERSLLDHGDTVVSPRSYAAAIAAINAALTAGDAVASGRSSSAFCAVRPPGHHALPDEAMGFCLFGTISILARYLQLQHGVGRVAIVDWDVHHGNGTQHFFYEDPSVFFVSLHQHPLWPGSGRASERGDGPGEGFTLNVPIPPFSPETEYLSAFETKVLPALDAFQPEFLLISAGFDAHVADPLASLQLTEASFGQLTRWLRQLAGQHCGGRIISCLEGGYDLDALEASVAAHVSALME
ncbi:MAG: histone deacetylase [Phycisphaerae bacterium]|nr:histone deacetylase [Phycisphaerae bacterium]